MTEDKMKVILNELKSHSVLNIDEFLPFPKPYHGGSKIKAIVLGMDPSTNDHIRFDTVFNLTGNDSRYFFSIRRNLEAINLSMENIYIQNFCQNYFTKPSYDQKRNWWRASAIWYSFLKKELDMKFDIDVPLLVTSEMIFHRLLYSVNEDNSYYYQNPENIPVESCFVKSGRMLIPFFRHWKYNLNRPEWLKYKEKLQLYFR